ncbi:MAG: histidinol-phosphate transaminase [Pseudomonadales bacterium]
MTYERDNIRDMAGYVSGEQPDDPRTIKLNTNENPWPPSPTIDKVLAEVSAADLRRYPSPTADRFRELAATHHGLSRDHIIATRGGDELLRLVITTFVDPGQTIAMTDPTYSLYRVLAQIQNCPVTSVPLDAGWQLPADFADIANRNGARLTLIVNPHAPSGRLLRQTVLQDLANELEGIVLVDEAYVDFIDPELSYDSIDLVRQCPNVILLRTLSKGYALAGLRFGYGIAQPDLIAPMLGKTRDSYNLDHISQQVAEAAITDRAWANSICAKVREERQSLTAALTTLGLSVQPSQSNFVLATIPPDKGDAALLYRALKLQGILVRYFDEPRLADKLRITIGTPGENQALLSALASLIPS